MCVTESCQLSTSRDLLGCSAGASSLRELHCPAARALGASKRRFALGLVRLGAPAPGAMGARHLGWATGAAVVRHLARPPGASVALPSAGPAPDNEISRPCAPVGAASLRRSAHVDAHAPGAARHFARAPVAARHFARAPGAERHFARAPGAAPSGDPVLSGTSLAKARLGRSCPCHEPPQKLHHKTFFLF